MNRDLRQREIESAGSAGGVMPWWSASGAIGRQAALQLAAVGVPS